MSPPSSGSNNKSRKKAATSVDFQRTARRYTPENSTFHNHLCENLKSHEITVAYCYLYIFITEAVTILSWHSPEVTAEIRDNPQ
jgi:hypothetical protein